MSENCIIIGASHAGIQVGLSLRQEGWQGRIIIIGDEPHAPYHRPPLSKHFLAGEKGIDEIGLRPASLYEKNNIELRQGVCVTSINRNDNSITLDDGEVLNYKKLALCTGSRVRTLSLPGSELAGVNYLRSLDDAKHIIDEATKASSIVIVGGGYIGLETASVLSQLGKNVTVLEMAPRILARVTSQEISDFYTRVHTEKGVDIRTDVSINSFSGEGHVSVINFDDGSQLEADLIIVGIGILPNVELAEDAGLKIDNGIVVDEFCCTSDRDIVAAGDCTSYPNNRYKQRIRLESVPNTIEQGKTAAAAICDQKKNCHVLPWFWSDQYDIKLQIAGLNQGYDEIIIRGDNKSSRSFIVFYLQEKKLIAADCINRPQEFMLIKRLIAEQVDIDISKLADEAIDLKELVV